VSAARFVPPIPLSESTTGSDGTTSACERAWRSVPTNCVAPAGICADAATFVASAKIVGSFSFVAGNSPFDSVSRWLARIRASPRR
jgi:hypothetical protein